MSGELSISYLSPDELFPHPGNPREHPNSALEKLESSIESFGWTNPIIAKEDNTILAGHARLKAAKDMGKDEVPVIHVDLDGKSADAYMIADNRTQQETEWEFEELADLMLELDDGDFDLELTGFDMDEIEDMMTWTPEPDELEEEPVPEEPKDPTTNKGDLWILGDHRLLCGDATDENDVERLMDGEQADMVFTDPPYNVAYGDSDNLRYTAHQSGKHDLIGGDDLSDEDWLAFNKNLVEVFKDNVTGDIYCWGAPGPDGMRQRLSFVENGLHWSATIIWNKDRLVLSPAKYQRKYEPCFYGWIDDNKSSYSGTKKETEVWEIDRPHKSEEHPTMKPVELCAKGINNSSNLDDIVLDLFLGSGSTLLAAEQTERKCYGTEMEPKYCDVIVERWENLTGQEAERIPAESLENEGESTDA